MGLLYWYKRICKISQKYLGFLEFSIIIVFMNGLTEPNRKNLDLMNMRNEHEVQHGMYFCYCVTNMKAILCRF